ncbi:MAG: Glucosamine--fructose-6-phosphate aminotransferase [isomerizing] [Candidatus Ozemobacter sibiricus]|jgi:glucosamine--fructose-6-phosphate aminotransferase (isomerizing)|uniref:Glutamine--fructose-6-phosphate aminotransferase [isomerizing] n=1 Tax=Candidatus Ozemobacter sibiricus TaxID=2268124 RepID=A0A367ZS26_9BACT|nr:MAG: Glucosamine--fructose-6-phosphate aminotransferase [isomerizing] [Candidatus Ozemobacter sibiricus]
MCGIIGYIGDQPANEVIFDGLTRLEYRGYDSAGIAVLDGGRIVLAKDVGKLRHLREILVTNFPSRASPGIGHTRWATHGRPSSFNAHPHGDCRGTLMVAHNGIIENYMKLKRALTAAGHVFQSETDTEVLAHLIESHYQGDLEAAVLKALADVEGAYALVVLHRDHPDQLVCVRKESPLIVGLGRGEQFIASDVTAIMQHTRQVVYLENGEGAVVRRDGVTFFDLAGRHLAKTPTTLDWNPVAAEKGGFPHFMLKEIYEQPQVIRNTIGGRTSEEEGKIYLTELGLSGPDIFRTQRIVMVGCGTAFYAGCVGKYLIEQLVRVPVECDLASEFRYRQPLVDGNTLVVAISQSGETADTLAAVREARARGAKVLGIVNAKESSLTREVDGLVYIHAGPEIGVASTKAYIGMLTAQVLLALLLGKIRGVLDTAFVQQTIRDLKVLPQLIERLLADTSGIRALAEKFKDARNFLYLGRGINFPTAMEGALKLKEISYIHAEAYAAGEMKHGPIALIDKDLPVMAIAANQGAYDKLVSNLKEVQARSGTVIAVASERNEEIRHVTEYVIPIPDCPDILSPILSVIPLQLFAYYVADLRGLDVDQPRNLAKSVTVE